MSSSETPNTPPPSAKPAKVSSLLDLDDPGGVTDPYDKVSLTKTLRDLELNLERTKVLPLMAPFGAELSNGISLTPTEIQFLLEHQTRWPLTLFEKTSEGVKVVEEKSSTTFIYFGGQPFFVSHQLATYLFDVASDFGNTPGPTVDLILSQFHNDLRRYPQTFLVYKGKDYRINLSHVNKLLNFTSTHELQPNRVVFSYLVFVYSFLKQTDPDFGGKTCP